MFTFKNWYCRENFRVGNVYYIFYNEYNWNAGLSIPTTFISLHIKLYEIKKIDSQVKTKIYFNISGVNCKKLWKDYCSVNKLIINLIDIFTNCKGFEVYKVQSKIWTVLYISHVISIRYHVKKITTF